MEECLLFYHNKILWNTCYFSVIFSSQPRVFFKEFFSGKEVYQMCERFCKDMFSSFYVQLLLVVLKT